MATPNRFITYTRAYGPNKDKNGVSIIILSASPGHRMRSFGNKCLLQDKHGLTLIENQTQIFKHTIPNSEIILTSGFESDRVYKNKPIGIRIVECTHYDKVNEIEEVRLAIINSTYDNVLITFGDLYFHAPFISGFKFEESAVIVDRDERMLPDDVGVTVVDGHATIFSLSLLKPKWCKTVFLKDKELRLFKSFIFDTNNSKLYLFESLNYILDKGGELKTHYSHSKSNLIHIDNSKELEKIQK